MELNFETIIVPYMQSVGRCSQSQELTQQVRLPDALPDIQNILSSWGQVVIRGKEWRSGCIEVSGGVKAWVLYTGEDGQKANPVETWLPFQFSWDVAATDRDGEIIAEPSLCSIDARTLSDRKILVRATVGIVMEALVPAETTVYDVGEVPAEVQILRNTYPMLLPVEAGEKIIQIEEPLDSFGQDPDISLLRYNLIPAVEENKIISDKLVMRGNAVLDVLFMDSACAIHSRRLEIPWSQYTQLNAEHEQDANVNLCFAVADMEIEKAEQSGFSLKCGIVSQYVVYENKPITVIEDAYVPNRIVNCTAETVSLPAILDTQDRILQVEADVQLLGHEILDISMLADSLQRRTEADRKTVMTSGSFQILSVDMEGNLCTAHAKWETNWVLDMHQNVQNDVTLSLTGVPKISGDSISGSIRLTSRSTATQGMQAINKIELGEAEQPDPNRPSIILRPIGNESLWQIAKSTGSTVDAIQKVNEIQQPVNSNQMLLIPIC